MDFTIYNTENAPEESREILTKAKKKFGFLPNLMGELAESPATLEAYLMLNEIIEKTELSTAEQQLVILATSIENECGYCSAIHSFILKNQVQLDEEIVDAVREKRPIESDAKLDALVKYTTRVVKERGHVSEQDVSDFLEAGYTKQNILDINLIVALKTISNYTNHIAATPLDEAFQSERIEFQTA